MRSRGSAGDAFAGGDKSAPLYLAALDGGSDGVPDLAAEGAAPFTCRSSGDDQHPDMAGLLRMFRNGFPI